jgi:hypothetical protein
MTQTNTAPIKWAQRSDSLYLTIALPGMFVYCLHCLLLLHESAEPSALLGSDFTNRFSPYSQSSTSFPQRCCSDVTDETINLTDTALVFNVSLLSLSVHDDDVLRVCFERSPPIDLPRQQLPDEDNDEYTMIATRHLFY